MSKVIAVILAGGKGERFGGETPKQFIKLSGKMVIEHTVEIFEASSCIDEIIVVSGEQYTDFIWDITSRNAWKKVQKVVSGGADRFGSTDSAIQAMDSYPDDCKVLFHDAVRPLMPALVIDACVDALELFEAVDVVIPSADTLVAVLDNGCISSIPPRASMRRGQTPQAFRLRTIRDAYAKARRVGVRDFTCDCGVVRGNLPHVAVATVQGAETNIKITNPLDLFLAEKLMQSAGQVVHDGGEPVDLSGKNIVVFGGSSGIGLAIQSAAMARNATVWSASRSLNGVDVADSIMVAGFLADVAGKAGAIDFVINTAGLLIRKPIDRMSPEEVKRIIDANYIGAVNVAINSKEHLARTRGMLINFTSSSYTRGRAQYAIYSSTKCAVVNLTQALAEEWNAEGIRVNCINTERTKTPMRTSNFGVEAPETLLEPETVAKRTLSVLVSHMTGMIIDVRRV